jgi:hypothetical protein
MMGECYRCGQPDRYYVALVRWCGIGESGVIHAGYCVSCWEIVKPNLEARYPVRVLRGMNRAARGE